jgi:hypothetical protein
LELYPEKEPDVHAINHICDRINSNICRPQMLEFARRHYSDGKYILAFLIPMKSYLVVIRDSFGTRMKTNEISLNGSKCNATAPAHYRTCIN